MVRLKIPSVQEDSLRFKINDVHNRGAFSLFLALAVNYKLVLSSMCHSKVEKRPTWRIFTASIIYEFAQVLKFLVKCPKCHVSLVIKEALIFYIASTSTTGIGGKR